MTLIGPINPNNIYWVADAYQFPTTFPIYGNIISFSSISLSTNIGTRIINGRLLAFTSATTRNVIVNTKN